MEDWKGLGNDNGLASACAQNGGKNVKDAGVEISFDYGGEDTRSIDEGFERDLNKGNSFLRELRPRRGGVLGEVGKNVRQNEDNDSRQFKKLFDILVEVISVFLIILCGWMGEAKISCNIHNGELDVQTFCQC